MSRHTLGDRPRHDRAYNRRQRVAVPSAMVLPPLLAISIALALAGALAAAIAVALSVATLGLMARMVTSRSLGRARVVSNPVTPIGSGPLVPATVATTTRQSPVQLAS